MDYCFSKESVLSEQMAHDPRMFVWWIIGLVPVYRQVEIIDSPGISFYEIKWHLLSITFELFFPWSWSRKLELPLNRHCVVLGYIILDQMTT